MGAVDMTRRSGAELSAAIRQAKHDVAVAETTEQAVVALRALRAVTPSRAEMLLASVSESCSECGGPCYGGAISVAGGDTVVCSGCHRAVA